MTSYEENQQYLNNLTDEALSQLEWYSAYQQLVDILNKEIEVLQALQRQRCEE